MNDNSYLRLKVGVVYTYKGNTKQKHFLRIQFIIFCAFKSNIKRLLFMLPFNLVKSIQLKITGAECSLYPLQAIHSISGRLSDPSSYKKIFLV